MTYEDNKVATRTADRRPSDGARLSLKLGKPLDMGQVFFAEAAIRDLLAEKGFLDAEVESDVRRVTETTRAVTSPSPAGGKTRIRKIDFTGNEVFKDKKLKSQLELTQERKWYWPWSQKNLYHPVKWDQDVAKVRDLYLNSGYLDVEMRAPIVEVRRERRRQEEEGASREGRRDQAAGSRSPSAGAYEMPSRGRARPPSSQKKQEKQRQESKSSKRKEEKAKKKVKRWVYLTVPVVEGEQYTLGEITFTGNDGLPDERLAGDDPAAGRRDAAQRLRSTAASTASRRLYEDRGHLYANVVRQIKRREGENDRRRRDLDRRRRAVLRRPHRVRRQHFDPRQRAAARVAAQRGRAVQPDGPGRLAAQGQPARLLRRPPSEPVIEPIEGENRVNVTIVGEEQGRNEIQVGGGYSGVDGAFFNGVYSTRNFLGRGQIVSARVAGRRPLEPLPDLVPGAVVPQQALHLRVQPLPP